MRILLYGEAERPGSGAWCYAQTLRDMGQEVFSFSDQEQLRMYRSNPGWKVFRKVTGDISDYHQRLHVRALLDSVSTLRPDIVVVLKGLHLGLEDVRAVKALGGWTVNVNHDDYFSANANNWSLRQREGIPAYDYIFTTREVNVGEIASLNPRVEFFPFAYYPKIHRPVHTPACERDAWNADVVFVGTWEKHRCLQLEYLVDNVECRYAVYGSQWNKAGRRSNLRRFIRFGDVVMDDLAKAIGSAKLALGFLRKENRDDYTQRTFEIPACGGVLLAERTARHMSLYREGIEAEFFDSPSELVAKVKRLLSEDDERESIRHAGQRALGLQKHTYRDRLSRLLDVYRTSA